jgi:hypothetical protein
MMKFSDHSHEDHNQKYKFITRYTALPESYKKSTVWCTAHSSLASNKPVHTLSVSIMCSRPTASKFATSSRSRHYTRWPLKPGSENTEIMSRFQESNSVFPEAKRYFLVIPVCHWCVKACVRCAVVRVRQLRTWEKKSRNLMFRTSCW